MSSPAASTPSVAPVPQINAVPLTRAVPEAIEYRDSQRLRPAQASRFSALRVEVELLRTMTYTVVDLETTGGDAERDGITEIGAVRLRGDQVLGHFQTLVDPGINAGVSLPSFISELTGITPAMLVSAPPVHDAVPAFFNFVQPGVLVAHNAGFDVSFLREACRWLQLSTSGLPTRVLDTAELARRLVSDEVENCRLATLAYYFNARWAPTHRALADAFATADVARALLGRLARVGVHTVAQLMAFDQQTTRESQRPVLCQLELDSTQR